jgi:TonB-linked SusC/RagA family outer membrane protein
MNGLGRAALLASLASVAWAPALTAQGAPGRVTGVVTSTEEARPMPGVNVAVKGSLTRTLTAPNGRYSIAAGANDTLVYRFLGYGPREIAVAGREVVNVVLTPQAVALSAIVVTGYGTQTRRDVTGAIASVSGENLTEVATPSVAQALQGRVAGVQVTPESGEPGAQAVVRIRGVGTLNNASPLYVVDGMLLDDIGFLNPNDIQSLEVLKDASSTAIYGSRGANGVIIVTTKKGVIEQGTRFTLNSYAGMQTVLNKIDLVTPQQYAQLANELAANTNVAPYFANPSSVTGIDWQDEIFESAPIMSHQLAASGGTNKITYYFSGNYFRQQGVLPKSDFNRLTLRLNNDYQLTDRLTLGHNFNFSYTSGQRPPGVLGMLYRADPTIPPRNPDGTFANANLRSSAGNPAAQVFYTRNEEDGRRLVAVWCGLRELGFRRGRPALCCLTRLALRLGVVGLVGEFFVGVGDAEDGVGCDKPRALGCRTCDQHRGRLGFPVVLAGQAEILGAVHRPHRLLDLLLAAAAAPPPPRRTIC